jgi:sulfide:quinone oxidoreductase
MKNVVIAGAGFAACTAVKTLRKQGYCDRITLIAPRAELFYYPSLIWVPAGRRDYQDLLVPLDNFLRANEVDFVAASIESADAKNNKVIAAGKEIAYDALIIATGGRYIRKLPGIEHACIACAGWDDTKRFSDRLAQMEGGTVAFGFAGNPNEPSAMRGGPVFEFLFGVDTLLRQQGRRDSFELVFFSPAPRPGQRLGEKAVDRLLGEMQKRGIKTHLGAKMKQITEDSVTTEKETFNADLVLFVPGMTGPQWAVASGMTLSQGGFFQANEFCQVEGQENVFVAGDAGSFPGPDWKPKQAHMADLQAEAAAKNVIEVLAHATAKHTFKTELICIVDSLNSGSLVYRAGKRSFMMKMLPLHWAKRFFERHYLRAYR